MTSLKSAPMNFRTQYTLPLLEQDEEINVDLFAGGGGASTGLEMGLGRPVHIAVNHNPAAISMHEANHPGTLHLQTDVWEVDPVQVLAGRRVGWFHASPDCTHHSQAAGGQPRKKEIRDLSWVVIKWAGIATPRIISLENVKQIRQWGPLIAKRCKNTGRVMRLDGTVAAPGERVPRGEQFLVPDPKRKGSTWRRFLQQLEGLGYTVEHRVLRACDYGAPTSRERLFLVARRDGEPIAWPEPTHAAIPAKGQKPYRTAAECIDWSIHSQSIFDRKKPLADATMRRIAKGIQREVLQKAKPFIVPIANWSRDAVLPVDQPLNTVTAWPRGGSFALASPHLVKFRFDEGGLPLNQPLPTITSGGNCKRPAGAAHAMGVATAFLAQANGGFNTTHSKGLDEPMTTVTNTGSQQQLVTANMVTLRKNAAGRGMNEPVPTLTAGAEHHALVTAHLTAMAQNVSSIDPEQPLPTVLAGAARFGVVECTLSPEVEAGALRCAAFLVNYYGNGDAREIEQPLDTITTRDRLALVTVWIGGDPYLIVDICLRMLQPHELYQAQGFPPNYIITHGHDGRRFTKSEQVHMCGNSVSPPPMAAIARANDPWRGRQAMAA
ncbi:DNA (cytosine-5)-methyltransferase 1 [Pseudomonas linyingensis]|uniref:DNA (cytosine-5-)-methyltransferase n=1 Tax=Pseudomonas linyingensis TaxID=915471 RepID=A0A1H6ZXL7_9PSED|nr:DNA cytosine methyltransferase [Pseudomonas linyingensis]SEJ56904.1 DNA (cytosine-5)-methyltransferase 1 [Pseudomonas linyingensis]